ncbi:MAG TPA: class I SAM-dependent methyltransferase [Streptosporangiaceae bacterium]
MTSTAELSPAAARDWIERWDAQQAGYVPHREERFTALIDAVAAAAGRDDPLVLDLGCGPGSLAVRLLDRLPAATVVAVDADPVLLALGQAAARPGLRFADLDLREPGWSAGLNLDRRADAAVSTTALHWLAADELAALYAELATVLRPGGVLVNGDHLADDPGDTPTLARLGDALLDAERQRQYPAGPPEQPENWTDWWSAVLADPVLAGPAARRGDRSRLPAHHTAQSELLALHVAGLRAAGFAEIGTIWQHGASRLLCAVTPAA